MAQSVTIIIADAHLAEGKEEYLLSQAAPCYVKKHKTSKIKKDALQALVAGYLLKRYLGISKDEQLTYNVYGKPSLASSETCFNISHSGDYVVLAIADCEVGVDIEKVMPFHEATVKKVLCKKQKEELYKTEGQARNEKFTQMWTQCEARLKLKGIGFGEGWEKEKESEECCSLYTTRIDDYFISCATENPADVEIEKLNNEDERWRKEL